MEIESMNFMESEEYAANRREGDVVRKKIQKHKKDFDAARREMRQAQERYEKTSGASTDFDDINIDIEHQQNDRLIKQKQQLEDVKARGYEMEDLAVGIKTNLKGQGEQMERIRRDMRGIRNDVSLSTRLLNAIEVQRKKNKCVLYAVYSLLILLFVFIIWWKFSWLLPSGGGDYEEPKIEYR